MIRFVLVTQNHADVSELKWRQSQTKFTDEAELQFIPFGSELKPGAEILNARHSNGTAVVELTCVIVGFIPLRFFLLDVGERPPGQELDRIDNDKGYEPGNCRWTSHLIQMGNARLNRRFTVDGISGHLAELCRQFSTRNADTVWSRLKLGWNIRAALLAPFGTKKKSIAYRNLAGIG